MCDLHQSRTSGGLDFSPAFRRLVLPFCSQGAPGSPDTSSMLRLGMSLVACWFRLVGLDSDSLSHPVVGHGNLVDIPFAVRV